MQTHSLITTKPLKKLNTAIWLTIVATIMMASSCSENETWADNYITNLAELTTDANGTVTQMRLDNGQTYTLANQIRLQRPDTTYRSICIYTQQGNSATISDYALTYSQRPITETTELSIKTDPCQMQSVWLSGNYLNARLLVQGKNQPHIIAFVDQGITTNNDGSHTLTIRLHHDQNNDPQAFTRTIYLSCPLKEYTTQLQHNRDSIYFVAYEQTYKLCY